MEKIFIKRLIIIMIAATLLLLALGNYFIKTSVLQNFKATSEVKINQVLQILNKNKKEIETLSATTRESYLSKARAVAYVVKNNPKIIDNHQELVNITKLFQIDEIYIFDEKGSIISATVPEYIGIIVDDGDQIGYFKQILDNPSLELVQDITPRTADGKLMQYSGVSRLDKKGIVQIGMRPERMIETLSRNNISHVLSSMVTDINEVICFVDKDTEIIKGIAKSNDTLHFHDSKFTKIMFESSELGKFIEVANPEYFAVIYKSNDGLIYVAKSKDSIMTPIRANMLLLTISLALIASLMIFVIKRLLEHHVIFGITRIISDLRKITEGNFDTIIAVNNNPEFKELSHQINTMVGYLLRSTSKISRIIDALDVNIAIYEYSSGIPKVSTTNRLASIIALNTKEELELFENKALFERKISQICKNYQDKEDKTIYRIPLFENYKYIKIKTFNDFDITMGIIIDVTDDIIRRDIMIHDRDYDILTELYNRRAFVRETDILFNEPEQLKITCVMMFDMDNLKSTNDLHGHHNGDKYIKTGADILRYSLVNERCIVSRLGGDEFSIIWYGYETQEQIIEKIDGLYARMMATNISVSDTKTIPVRFSGGYAFYPEHSQNKSLLLKLSDKALYFAKHNHKCKFIRYTQEM